MQEAAAVSPVAAFLLKAQGLKAPPGGIFAARLKLCLQSNLCKSNLCKSNLCESNLCESNFCKSSLQGALSKQSVNAIG